jgi:hypothetical protein
MTDARADKYVQEVFTKNVPLYMTLLLTDDQNVLENMFTLSSKFKKSLISEDEKFMKMFLDFINPFIDTESTKPIMSYLVDKKLKNKTDHNIEIPLY